MGKILFFVCNFTCWLLSSCICRWKHRSTGSCCCSSSSSSFLPPSLLIAQFPRCCSCFPTTQLIIYACFPLHLQIWVASAKTKNTLLPHRSASSPSSSSSHHRLSPGKLNRMCPLLPQLFWVITRDMVTDKSAL